MDKSRNPLSTNPHETSFAEPIPHVAAVCRAFSATADTRTKAIKMRCRALLQAIPATYFALGCAAASTRPSANPDAR